MSRQALDDSVREIIGVRRNRFAVAALLARCDVEAKTSGSRIPLTLPTEDMERIGWGNTANMSETAGGEPVERRLLRCGGQKLGQRLGLIGDPGVEGSLLRREPCGHRIGQPVRIANRPS